MPEFTVKEVRLPELHLPEIKRDEIVRSLSGVRLPEVDLAKARRASIKVPTVTLTGSDIGKLVAAGAAIARFARPIPSRGPRISARFGRGSRSPLVRIVQPRRARSRWPIAIAVIIAAAIGAWALLRRPAVRRQVDEATHTARTRFEAWRAASAPDDESFGAEPPAIDTVPREESAAGAVVVAAGVKDETSPRT
jgi:hypothetical protein